MKVPGARCNHAKGGPFPGLRRGVEIRHLRGTTLGRPAFARSGERVLLRFRVSPNRPDLHLYLVVENFRADGFDEMPRVVKATRYHSGDAASYWHCHIGPFEEGDLVAYFATGHWGGREIICGKRHWFRVPPAHPDAKQLAQRRPTHETGHGRGRPGSSWAPGRWREAWGRAVTRMDAVAIGDGAGTAVIAGTPAAGAEITDAAATGRDILAIITAPLPRPRCGDGHDVILSPATGPFTAGAVLSAAAQAKPSNQARQSEG